MSLLYENQYENQDLETQNPLQTALQALHPDIDLNAYPAEIGLLQRLLARDPDAYRLLIGLTDVYSLSHTGHLLVHHLNTPEQPTLIKTLLNLHFYILRPEQVARLLSLVLFTTPISPAMLAQITETPEASNTSNLLIRRGLVESDDQNRLILPLYLRPYLKHRLGIEERERLEIARDQHYRNLIHSAASKLRQTPDLAFLDRLDADAPSILAFLRSPQPDTLALLNSLWRWWVHRRPATEGIDLFQATIDDAGPKTNPALLCQAERAIGVLWRRVSRQDLAIKNLDSAIQHAAIARKEEIVMEAALYLSLNYRDQGQFDLATSYARQSLQLALKLRDMWSEAAAQNSLGTTALQQDDTKRAKTNFLHASALYAHLGDHLQAAKVQNNIGLVAEAQSDYLASEIAFQQALQSARRSNDPLVTAQALHNLAGAYCHQQKYVKSNQFYTESLAIMLHNGYLNGVPLLLSNMAYVALQRGYLPRALTLYGVSDNLRRLHAIQWPARALEEHTAALEAIYSQTTATVITRNYRKGYQMGLEELKAYLVIS